MKFPYFFILFSILFSTSIIGQTSQSIEDADKKALKCYTKGKSALSKKDFKKAEKHFKSAIKRNPDILAFKRELGTAYLGAGKQNEAVSTLESIVEIDQTFDPRIAYTLYKLHNEAGNAAKAKQFLSIYNDQLPADHKNKAKIKQLLNANYIRDSLMANPVNFVPERLDSAVNSQDLEYLPAITADGNNLVFTRRLNNQEDIYSAQLKDGKYVNVKALDEINTSGNEGAHCISQDGKLMIFTKEHEQRRGNFDLYYSVKRDAQWSAPKSIGNNINTEAWESQPSLSADGKTLYFSSNREGGYGNSDLYSSVLKDRVWQKPQNLGPAINTKGNEESPFIHPDNKTLYFRSDKHPGMGSFDIFFAKKTKGAWSQVKNIGYPINSEGQEGALFVSLDGSYAYYASDGDSKGNVDIYKFKMPESLQPAGASYVKFMVEDGSTGKPLPAEIKIVDLDDPTIESVKKTDGGGEALVVLTEGTDYAIYVEKSGFLFHSEHINFKESDEANPISKIIKLQAIQVTETSLPPVSEPIILQNIFFASGSAQLLANSNQEIEKLSALLKDHPNIRIEIIGHTDNVGAETDNQLLSLQRAQAVQQSLIEKGIDRSRITATGKGETQAIASNEDEAGRAQNRRTEFIVYR